MKELQSQQERFNNYWGLQSHENTAIEEERREPIIEEECRNPTIHLSPRLTSVANLLYKGFPRKMIASELEISVHTVNGYVKQVYAVFNVHSQVEFVLTYARYLSQGK